MKLESNECIKVEKAFLFDIYMYKGRVFDGLFVMSSLLNFLMDRKTDYINKYFRVKGWFLG